MINLSLGLLLILVVIFLITFTSNYISARLREDLGSSERMKGQPLAGGVEASSPRHEEQPPAGGVEASSPRHEEQPPAGGVAQASRQEGNHQSPKKLASQESFHPPKFEYASHAVTPIINNRLVRGY